ncbi:hypothetical protein EON83_00900 [bacterium]|nr:MAG: hypothetical protein EON83_00900 [bacterium]
MKRALAFSLLLAAPSVAVLPASAQAPAASGFQYLDDEVEDPGFDVTAKVTKFGSELALNQAANGDGYVLRLSNGKADLLKTAKGKTITLASAPIPKVALPAPLVAQRRGPRWRFTIAGQTMLEAEDDTWTEGKIGTRNGITEARLQPVEPIAFDDDFMRVASDVAIRDALQNPRNGVKIRDAALTETIWTGLSGSWKTTGLTENAEAQVAQSANPFAFRPMAKGDNLSIAGRPFWSDYETSVSVQPQGAREIGLLCNVQDAKNYLGLFWSDSAAPELRAVVDGKVRVLARAAGMGGYEKDEWTKFKVVAASGTLRAFIDDAEVARAHTGLFGRGQIGLLAKMDTAGDDQKGVGAVFDDVSVRSLNDFFDPFQTPVAGRWTTVNGNFAFGNGVAKPANNTSASAVMGEANWADYVAAAQLSIPAGGAAGLILNHKGGDGSYMLRVGGSKSTVARGQAQLVQNVKGKIQVLTFVPIGAKFDGSNHVWTLSDERGYLSAKCDGELVVDAFNADRKDGRAGIWVQNGALARSFSVEWPQTRPTWAKVPALYEVEQQAETMGGWSTSRGFWIAQKQDGVSTLEHKGRFWGDETLRFPLPDLAGGKTATVSLGKVSVSLDATGAKVSGGTKPAAGKADLKTGAKVEIAQRGNFIIVRADDALVVAARV